MTAKPTAQQKAKVKKVMDEWKAGTLHSGSKSGPPVYSQKQALAIAMSEPKQARRRRLKSKHRRS